MNINSKGEASCSLAADQWCGSGLKIEGMVKQDWMDERANEWSELTQVSAGEVAQAGDTSDARVSAPHVAAIFFVVRPTASSCEGAIIA